MAPRLVVSVCLALFLTLACGAALGFATPPQPLTGNPADRLLDRRDYSLHAEGRALDWHLDASDPTDRRAARRDHIHLGLSRAGAAKRTSFWR